MAPACSRRRPRGARRAPPHRGAAGRPRRTGRGSWRTARRGLSWRTGGRAGRSGCRSSSWAVCTGPAPRPSTREPRAPIGHDTRMADLPPCGIYRTTRALGDDVPAGRLVFFHRHGDPGPGVYLPSGWTANRARWHEHGHTIPSTDWADSLVPLPAEGFYRVREEFTCCAKNCRTYEVDLLV